MSYIYIHKSDISSWQKESLKIQQDVQHILDEENIPNWCGGGTLIGAVREKGFLTWDNDLDLFILRSDLKRILYKFWAAKMLHQYEIWSQEGALWHPNDSLNALLISNVFDESFIDHELKSFSKGMFKIFSKNIVWAPIYDNDFGKPDEFIKVSQYKQTNMTPHRDAHTGEKLINGKEYGLLVNICVLPMIEITLLQYVFSTTSIVFGQGMSLLGEHIRNHTDSISARKSPGTKLLRKTPEDSSRSNIRSQDTVRGKVLLSIKSFRLAFKAFVEFIKQYPSSRIGDPYIAYQPLFFRISVRPFRRKDIFPLRKARFEHTQINVPANAHDVLKTQFGNYETAPPVKHRIATAFFLTGKI